MIPLPVILRAAESADRAYRYADIADERTDTQVCMDCDSDWLTVSFRGTSSLRDMLTDARIRRRTFAPAGSVHRGFSAALESVWRRLDSRLRSLHPARRVLFTGHSLGGALAMLAAARSVDAGHSVWRVVTFGQPRLGNRAFASWYDRRLGSRTLRVVNVNDPVPRLPGPLSGYRHCGGELFFDAFGGMIFNPPWWRKLPSDIAGLAASLDPVLPLTGTLASTAAHHGIARYVAQLKRNNA